MPVRACTVQYRGGQEQMSQVVVSASKLCGFTGVASSRS